MDDLQIPGLEKKRHRSVEQLKADIPAMPVVALHAMRELGNPKAAAKQVGEIIALDQAMTSRLLRIANSPVFGPRRKISTVTDALVLMGFSAVKGLVITVSTRGICRRAGLLEQLLWEHSIGAAMAAMAIAQAAGGQPPDEAFVGGLIHDIGRAVFANLYRQDYELLFQHLYNKQLPRSRLVDLEIHHFGLSHMELGRAVVEKWNLAEDLKNAASGHHAKTAEELDSFSNPWPVAIVGLADAVCLHLGIGMHEPDTSVPLYDSIFTQRLELPAERIAGILEQTTETFEAEKATFSL